MRNIFTNNSNPGDNKKALKKLPCKQIILFATSCARSVLHLFEERYPNDSRPRLAIETAEKFVASADAADVVCWSAIYAADAVWFAHADHAAHSGYASYASSINSSISRISNYAYAADAAAYAARSAVHAADAAAYATYAAADAVNAVSANNSQEKWDWIYNLYQVAYNNGKPFPQSWKTEKTINLAKTIIETRNFNLMPILADTLEDAGCNDYILNHLRNNKDLWALSDWTLFNLGY